MTKIITQQFILSLICSTIVTFSAFAQTSISGSVLDSKSRETLLGVNIQVKGKVIGTISDTDGNFSLNVSSAPPFTLVFSMIGYTATEIEINQANIQGLEITLDEAAILGQEVVVSASRVEESILQSPVSIEKMDILAVQNTASDDYYKGIANLKGVDMVKSSINFQIVNARGFNSTGNTRFVQLIDGMDTQAPALNFPIGNLNGPSQLDVESLELIPGASSALYGPNAFNGILLVNSKNAFDYQGFSFYGKMGVNHVGSEADRNAAPLYDVSLRYAKAFNNKFAFKVNFSYSQAQDWHGNNAFDRNPTPEGFTSNPGADFIHKMGDEAITNMGFLGFAARTAYNVQGTTDDTDTFKSLRAAFNGITSGRLPVGYGAQDYLSFIPSQNVARTGYAEKDLIDYTAKNLKVNTGLYYRLNDKIEASYLLNYGGGTSIYTGAQRYSLKNFAITQHRLQLRGDNFYIRGYTTIENSGDSYITEFLGNVVNESYSTNNGWFAAYTANYISYLGGGTLPGGITGLGLTPDELSAIELSPSQQEAAHNFSRERADALRHDPTSKEFKDSKEEGLTSGVVPDGPKFADKSKLYHVEGQYDFKNEIGFMDLQAGASYKVYDLRSKGTIFPDADGGIQINEYGAYLQASKRVANDNLKLLTSLRFDKNENFDGQFNPRLSAVYTIANDHNIRGSYQTGFRNPSTQGQYINLDIISTRLLGGLPEVFDQYGITENSYTGQSVAEYTNAIYSGTSIGEAALLLEAAVHTPVRPEEIQSMEVGYKSVVGGKLLIDAVYYYNVYNNFITQIQMRKASANVFADPNNPDIVAATSLISGSSDNNFQVYTNIDNQVTSQGAAVGLTYNLPKNYTLTGNYSWNKLNEDLAAQGFLNEFNTPEHKVNFSFANRKVTDNLGFNVTWRWQDAFRWESSFARGDISAFNTVDAQVSYKMSKIKSVFKFGGSNILNKKYNMSLGGPNIGAIYYVSVTFDQFLN